MQQAEKLDELLKKRGIAIDRVLNFDVPDSTLVSVSTLAVLRILQPCCRVHSATACMEKHHVLYGAMTFGSTRLEKVSAGIEYKGSGLLLDKQWHHPLAMRMLQHIAHFDVETCAQF